MGSRPWKAALHRRILRAQAPDGRLVLTVARGCDSWHGQVEAGRNARGERCLLVDDEVVPLDQTTRIEGVPARDWRP